MSNGKKFLSIVMSIALVLNVFAVIGFAVDPAENVEDYSVDVSFETPKLKVYPGETFTVTMKVGTNCYFGGATLPVFYDTNVFDIEDDSAALKGNLATYASVSSAVSASGAITWPSKLNGVSVTSAMKKQYGVFNVNVYADRYVGTTAKVLSPAEEAITLTLKISDSATVGSKGLICLEPTALRTSSAMTNKMTAYAFKKAEVNTSDPNVVNLLPVNVADAKLTFEVVVSPEFAADLTGLQSAYSECGQITDASSDNYITSTWVPYRVARNAASQLLSDASLTKDDQEEVDNAATALRNAFAALKPAGKTSDYSAVDEALKKVPSEYALQFYTEASVTDLNSVLDDIDRELPPTQQDVIDDYVTRIETAVKSLVPDESRAVATAKLTFDKETANPGDEVTVKLFVGTNYAVEALEIPVFYDTDCFEFVDGSMSFDSALAKSGECDYNVNPLSDIYSRRDTTDTTWESFWTDGANAKYKAILIDWYQDGEEGHEISKTADISEAFATFKLKVKETAADGDAKAFLCDAFIKDADCMGGVFFVARDVDLDATNISLENPVGQTYVLTDGEAICTIESVTPPEGTTYGIVEGSTGVFDEDNKFFYGFTRDDIENGIYDEIIDNYIWVKNGSIAFDFSGNLSGEDYFGTGTVINILDKDGEIVASYTIVVFGDVNGDAVVDVFDVSDMIRLTNYDFEFEEGQEAYMAAADTDGDSDISVFDLGDVINASNYDGYISQTELNPATGGRYFAEV